MLKGLVSPVCQHRAADLCSGDLAVSAGKGQYLVSCGFNGAGLMDMDMTALGAENALVGSQSRIDDCQIGLGTSYQKVDRQILVAADFRILSAA